MNPLLTCELKPLLAALKAAKRITGTRNTVPVLGYAKIADGALSVTDLDKLLTAPLEPVASGDAFLLPVDAALKLLSGVKAGALVHIAALTPETLTLAAGDLTAEMDTLPVGDFPTVFGEPGPWFGGWALAAEESDLIFRAAAGCMSDEETRYYLRGINFCEENERLTLVSTDGHRLAHIATKHPYTGAPVIMPSDAVKLALELGLGACELSIGQRTVRLCCAGYTLITKAIDGTFPDYTRVMPRDITGTSAVAVADLKDAAGRIAKILGDVAAVIDQPMQTLSAAGTDTARRVSIKLELAAEKGLGVATSGYNAKYLVQMATLCGLFDDLLIFGTTTNSGDPALIKPDAQPDFAHAQFVLMPRRF
jgi:DNA polymerase-3 subunit beta